MNKKNSKTRIKLASTKRQTTQDKKINELYQPLIDQATYIDDQLILLNQLLSRSKLCSELPFDSISILNRAEYMLNLCRSVFRDVSTLLSQICDFDSSIPSTNSNRVLAGT
jgi:phosphate uptake regulator